MAAALTKRLHRGLDRARIKLCKRVLTTLLNRSAPPGPTKVFTTTDQVVAVNVVLAALIAALSATRPR